jgi:hypothetical protein
LFGHSVVRYSDLIRHSGFELRISRYNAGMTGERLRNLWKAEPFRPFIIHLADGRRVPVKHPEFLMPSPSGRTVVVSQADDSLNIIDLLLVTDLELAPNGRGKVRRRGGRNP